jgi:hypothetical protein
MIRLRFRLPFRTGISSLSDSGEECWLRFVVSQVPKCEGPGAPGEQTWNYLLNPEHPDAKLVVVAEVIRERFDNRLFRFGAR